MERRTESMMKKVERHVDAMYNLTADEGCNWSAPHDVEKMLKHAQAVVDTINAYNGTDTAKQGHN